MRTRIIAASSLLIFVLVASARLNAQGFGARATAMGGAYVALADDPFAISWNPAGLSFLKPLSFGMEGRFMGSNKSEFSLSDFRATSEQSYSPMLTYLGTSVQIQRVTLGLAYAPPPGSADLKYDYSYPGYAESYSGSLSGGIHQIAPAIAVRADNFSFGLSYTNFSGDGESKWSDGSGSTQSPSGGVLTFGTIVDVQPVRWGAVVDAYLKNNLSAKYTFSDGSWYQSDASLNKPVRGITGVGIVHENFVASFDYQVDAVDGSTPQHYVKTGIEVPIPIQTTHLFLRAGYWNQFDKVNKSVSAGLGFQTGMFGIDLAYRYGYDNVSDVSYTSNYLFISTSFNLDIIRPPSAPQTEPSLPPVIRPSGVVELSAVASFVDSSRDGVLDAGEEGKLVVSIKNTGDKGASGISVKLSPTVVEGVSFPSEMLVGEITAGGSREISIPFIASHTVGTKEVSLQLTVTEASGHPPQPIDVKFSTKEIPKPKVEVAAETPVPVEVPIDVEENIPVTSSKNKNAVALIIAISDYQNPSVPKVEYAKRDAQYVREYLTKTFGYDPKNILPQNPEELMTLGNLRTYLRGRLPAYLRPDGSSDVFIYFTGHGAPNTTTNEPFFVPYDCDPNYVNNDNAYNMNDFYTDVSKLHARQKIVVIDACFSGHSGGGTPILKYASPALLKVKNVLLTDTNCVVFQSSQANEVSNWFPEKKHGMFTYFFLKGLHGAADTDNDGTITVGELERFINDGSDGLPYHSNREFGRPQRAVVVGEKEEALVKVK